jgi:hypothetical protein
MFRKLDIKKIRVAKDPTANSASSANPLIDDPGETAKTSKISGISNPLPPNSHFGVIEPELREGPPYPDGLGLVKCFYCEHCEITEHKVICLVTRKPMTGIALLRECEHFVTKTVH